MKSKISLYTIIGILIFILVATICPDCAERGSREELEWQKSKKIAEGMSEEEAYEAAKKEIEKEELDAEIFEDSGDEYLNGDEDDAEDREEQEKIEREQAAAEAELEEGFEEEEKLIPSEPITLKGSVWESALTLIIDLQTGEVGGSIYFDDGEDTYNLTIDGNIDLETYKIDGNCSGIWVSQALGTSETITVTIEGQLNEDFSGASGTSTGNAGTDNWTAN